MKDNNDHNLVFQSDWGAGNPNTDPPEITTISFTLKDLEDCLKDSVLGDEVTLDTIADMTLKWYTVVQQISKKTALLAWRTGGLLNRAKEMVEHGEWQTYCKDKLGMGKRWGLSETTIWRWRTLATRLVKGQVASLTLTEAYLKSGILQPKDRSWEAVSYRFEMLTEQALVIKKKIESLQRQREEEYQTLVDDEMDEDALSHLFTHELKLNHALKVIVDAIDYCPVTLVNKYEEHQQFLCRDYFKKSWEGLEWTHHIDLECVPSCILTEKQKEVLLAFPWVVFWCRTGILGGCPCEIRGFISRYWVFRRLGR